MELSPKTARQMFEELRANPARKPYGFGTRPMLVNVDLQCAYTQPDTYVTAYETDPKQADYVNRLAELHRKLGLPVVWTYVAFNDMGDDCGVFGTRGDAPDDLKMIKIGSERAALDPRLVIGKDDIVLNKKMPSAFFETHLQSLATFHKIDTVIVTGGSTSGCVRATVVDALSRSYFTIVPEECVADLHESPHFANLYDMHKKYADVLPVSDVFDWLEGL
ncbi:isochorismatase family protein [Pseudooceanicola nanhaiensis]|uniref:isochorismatase family protein n=1 Tax=Pseudooceanicola nanhaiensis TaxID=375761 RepID=UPI001CD31245|nr:isochorismatase family protein [Pseudooceanicola nanhaiensis]MCA0921286.1 isochorismatase family protein [Pseudooceanicola nanhaiensis]